MPGHAFTFQVNVTNRTNEDEIMPMRMKDHQSGHLRLLFQDPRRGRDTVSLAF